ncbi:FecR family protein [Brevundimonas sp.]
MAGPRQRVEKADTEAASWHVRLGEPGVSPQTLQDFFAWRQVPEHAEAYRRVETVWGQSAALAGDPAIMAALDGAMGRRVRKQGRHSPSRRRVWFPVIGAVAVAGLAAAYAGWTWMDARTLFSTGVGEQRVVQLADGSSVQLDTDTAVRVRFDGDERLLELERGQALFTVAHEAGRPFVVQAGEARVTAVGTVFDVQREGQGASVTLVSGVVDVAGAGEGAEVRRMAAGQQARLVRGRPITRPVDTAAETSWTTGRIVFRDTPLAEAVAEVNRYLPEKITLEAGAASGRPVNGVFRAGDRDAFVSAAADVFDLQVERGTGETVRLSERGK